MNEPGKGITALPTPWISKAVGGGRNFQWVWRSNKKRPLILKSGTVIPSEDSADQHRAQPL